jgi:hypothetical protein
VGFSDLGNRHGWGQGWGLDREPAQRSEPVVMTAKRDPMRVFGPIAAWEVRSLAGPVVEVNVAAGARLVREGLVIGTFFLIRSGRADLMTGEHKLATLEVGDCFGEIDAAPTRPQRFTVIATAPTRVLTFSAFGMSRLCATITGARERIRAALPDERRYPHPGAVEGPSASPEPNGADHLLRPLGARLGARGAALHDLHAAPRDERDALANAALALAVDRS